MKIIIIVLLVVVVLWVIGSWVAVRNLEEPKYTIVNKEKEYEVRLYEPYIIAETSVSGSYDKALNDGFRNIADYIFGNNTASEKIAMTTPVKDDLGSANASEKIAMTVPVLEQGSETERKISFVMPSKYTLETIPKPNTELVTLREIPEKKMAVLRYTWYTNEKRIEKKTSQLLQQLEKDGFTALGEVSSARYNPPFSMPLLLRNEILVEVE